MFVVERGDQWGNTGRPKSVIEVEPDDEWFHRILGPAEISLRWSRISLSALFGHTETEGPARMLTNAEWTAITGQQIL